VLLVDMTMGGSLNCSVDEFEALQGVTKDYRCTADGLVQVSADPFECNYEVADF